MFYCSKHLNKPIKEIELIGMFNAFVKSASPTAKVYTNYKIVANENIYRPDIFIESKDKKIIIEIKRALKPDMSHEDQLLEYLKASNVGDGILWYPESVPGKNFLIVDDMAHIQNDAYYITTISTFHDK